MASLTITSGQLQLNYAGKTTYVPLPIKEVVDNGSEVTIVTYEGEVRPLTPSEWGYASSSALAAALIPGADASVASGSTADFLAIKRGLVPGVSSYNKFGENPDVDAGNEDIWNAGGEYTGHNATSGEAVEVISTDAADTGTLLSSGTATGGSASTIEDSGATFVTDGVAVGDLVINDSQLVHGIVTAVTSETELAVFDMHNPDDPETTYTNESGDSYRVVTPASTGAAVIRLSSLLESDLAEFKVEYVITAGLSAVDTTGTDYIRNSRAIAVLSGSNGSAVGTVQGRQTTTTANVFWRLSPGDNQSQVCADTVPAGRTLYAQVSIQMSRANGAGGSAAVEFLVRPYGEGFQQKAVAQISQSQDYATSQNKYIGIPGGSDIKWRCVSVSDTNTELSAKIDGFLVVNS